MLGKAKLYREISQLEIENDRLRIEWRNETLEQANTIEELEATILEEAKKIGNLRAVNTDMFHALERYKAHLPEAEKELEGCRDKMLERADTIMVLKRTIDAQLDRLKSCSVRSTTIHRSVTEE